MKKRLTQTISIIILFLIPTLFSFFLVKQVEASTSDLENVSSDIAGLLQKAAAERSDDYFNFNAKKIVNKAFYVNQDIYNIFKKGAYCMSLVDNGILNQANICAILDVLDDGSVKVTNKYGTKTYTDINDTKVGVAHQLAYLATKSIDNNEANVVNGTDYNAKYKLTMTYGVIAPKFDYLQDLGIPSILNPKSNVNAEVSDEQAAFVKPYVEESWKEAQNMNYTARIVFMYGYQGQNQFIFSGKKKNKRIEIVKKDAEGKKLPGAEFKVYKDKKLTEPAIAKGTTGTDGKVVFSSDKFEAHHEYYIVETKAPPGYVINNGEDGYRTAKIGNKGTTIIEATNFRGIGLIKKDAEGNKLPGAKFKVYKDKELKQKITEGVTGTDGRVVFNSKEFKEGQTYYIVETEAPPGYVINNGEKGYREATISEDKITIIEATNFRGIGLEKKDNKGNKLPGAKFKAYKDKELKQKITEGVTGKDGRVVFSSKEFKEGQTYYIVETEAPPGYVINNGEKGYRTATIAKDKITTITATNFKKTTGGFKLSGYVWEDKISGKQSLRNDLYKDNDFDSEDDIIPGVTVRLKEKSGKVVKETKTYDNGKYEFLDVDREKLKDYLIEFEYDGITYTNVVPHIDKDNGSKAIENTREREEFNNGFSTIEGNGDNTGYTLDQNGNKKHNLAYEKDIDKHTSTFINKGKYPIKANTDLAGYKISEHYNDEKNEITNINLGLYRREQPDLALIKDTDNVKLAINGSEHIYNYAQRFNNQGEYGDGFDIGVKFGNKYGSMEYTRPIYKADYEFESSDKSKELKTYITYKIAIRNESTNLTSQVNSLVDYFDSRYLTDVKVGTNKNERTGEITGDVEHEVADYNGEYKKLTIKPNKKIEAQKTYEIYVQFQLSREAVKIIVNDRETLENVIEINSYSTFGENGKAYAGIDVDSNPGNAKPGDKSTYEDDTDSSPAIKLQLAQDRELSGKVFLDETNMPNLETNKERRGNGRYDQGERGIPGVTVTLTGNGRDYTTTTDDGGNYAIPALPAGTYRITFTWGDDTYTVQNYKGTIYDRSREYYGDQWYKHDVGIRASDAIDDYDTRIRIDQEMKQMEKGNKNQYTIRRMESTTPEIRIPVEYDGEGNEIYYTYDVKNVDFGIVERPRQEIELKKRVKNMKLALANGQTIADIEIDENGKITGQKDGIVYMGPSQNTEPKNGFLKLEMDNELIEGSKLSVTYEIEAINKSELDYATEEYYKYGITGGQKVTIMPSAVIDYLDKDWGFDNEENPGWEIKTEEELKNLVAKVVYADKESTIDSKIILYTENLKTELEPAQTKATELKVSKILTTADDISLDNETEIIKIDKPHGGSDIPSIPGNYIPGTGEKEPDDSVSETVIVTPNTGENRNFIILISVGLVSLALIGIGIIFIKKKVLNK